MRSRIALTYSSQLCSTVVRHTRPTFTAYLHSLPALAVVQPTLICCRILFISSVLALPLTHSHPPLFRSPSPAPLLSRSWACSCSSAFTAVPFSPCPPSSSSSSSPCRPAIYITFLILALLSAVEMTPAATTGRPIPTLALAGRLRRGARPPSNALSAVALALQRASREPRSARSAGWHAVAAVRPRIAAGAHRYGSAPPALDEQQRRFPNGRERRRGQERSASRRETQAHGAPLRATTRRAVCLRAAAACSGVHPDDSPLRGDARGEEGPDERSAARMCRAVQQRLPHGASARRWRKRPRSRRPAPAPRPRGHGSRAPASVSQAPRRRRAPAARHAQSTCRGPTP